MCVHACDCLFVYIYLYLLSSSSFTGQNSFYWIIFYYFILFFIPLSVLVPSNSQKVSLMAGSPFPSAFPFSQLLPESQTGEYFPPSADTDRPTLKAG